MKYVFKKTHPHLFNELNTKSKLSFRQTAGKRRKTKKHKRTRK